MLTLEEQRRQSAEIIQEMLEAHGNPTAQEVEKTCGVSPAAVNKHASGRAVPTDKVILKYARQYGFKYARRLFHLKKGTCRVCGEFKRVHPAYKDPTIIACPDCHEILAKRRYCLKVSGRKVSRDKLLEKPRIIQPRPRPCAVPGCGKPVKGKNLCQTHYTTSYRKRRRIESKALAAGTFGVGDEITYQQHGNKHQARLVRARVVLRVPAGVSLHGAIEKVNQKRLAEKKAPIFKSLNDGRRIRPDWPIVRNEPGYLLLDLDTHELKFPSAGALLNHLTKKTEVTRP